MNFEKKESVATLVIGGSGHGKSEFILSFINEEARKKIPASGEGQTTRTSMEYRVSCETSTPLRIEVKLKEKDKFVEERLAILDKKFDSKPNNSFAYDELKESLINDDAFFNISEFGEEASKFITEKYKEIFSMNFFEDNVQEKKDNEDNESKEKNYFVDISIFNEIKGKLKETLSGDEIEKNSNVKLSDCFKLYFEYVYKYCKKIIMDKYEKGLLEDLSKKPIDEISSFLKTEENKISYSSLVDTVIINTYIADYYKELFEKTRISEIIFVDTYGLDHDGPGSENIIKNRYQQLLNRDYPSIKTVFYLRKINDTDAPADLQQNIPLLFSVAPTVVPYIIFTKIDKLDTGFTDSKAYKEIDKSKNKIGKILCNQGVSMELINNRFSNLLNNRIGYCSWIGKDDGLKTYDHYLEKNIEGLKKIFSAVRYKKHLGSNLIPINKLELSSLKDVLDVKKIFTSQHDFDFYQNYYPSRTKGALADRLQSGTLGFVGTTTASTCWSDLIGGTINSRFNNIVNLYNWSKYFNSDNILTTLSELFLVFASNINSCIKYPDYKFFNYVDFAACSECNQKNKCIKEIIYKEKKKIIEYKYYPVADWLDSIYSFSVISDEAKKNIQEVINFVFEGTFKDQCRQHNARVLALEISDDSILDEFELRLEKYYREYDSNLSDEDKVEFEQIVNAYIQ